MSIAAVVAFVPGTRLWQNLEVFCQIICIMALKVIPLRRNRKITMKRYKVKEVIKLLEQDGWYLVNIVGDHRQYKHHTKSGRVTVAGKSSATMNQFDLNSIWKQAGWK